jgi:hypothetical protein
MLSGAMAGALSSVRSSERMPARLTAIFGQIATQCPHRQHCSPCLTTTLRLAPAAGVEENT